MGCCYKNLLTRQRLFALHHVLERRARAKRRIVGRRNLQRRTRGRVTSLASGARLSGKRAKLGDGHLVARANRRADLVKRRRQHASDVRLRLTRLRRHGIDESLLVQSRRRVSSAIEFRAHSSVVPPVRALASRFQFKTRRPPIDAHDPSSRRSSPRRRLDIARDMVFVASIARAARFLAIARVRRGHRLSRAFERRANRIRHPSRSNARVASRRVESSETTRTWR